MNSFPAKVTAKGTELPVMALKGKPYLQVAYRLLWFREEHPDWGIETDVKDVGGNAAVATAKIFNERGFCIAMGSKKESEDNFADYIEKAETGAIGRALAIAGYGTQFDPELDEGERIVDAPLNGKGGTDAKLVPARSAKSKETKQVPAKTEKDRLIDRVVETGLVAVALKKITIDEISKQMLERYGISSSKELTVEQATEFLNYLQPLL